MIVKDNCKWCGLSFIYLLLCCVNLQAQKTDSAQNRFVTLAPGPQYQKSSFHQWLWGKHYRREWATPVTIKKILLDTAFGGLIPYEAGGGRQSKTLRLRDAQKQEYVLRSIDKTFGGALPDLFRNTFVESVINDQASIAHPFSAVTIAPMADAARIYHTWPQNVFVPHQLALDSFNKDYGNTLYLLEQRPDENWQSAPNFGNAPKIISTIDMLEKLLETNAYKVDQAKYIRSRLFDMFIGDWGRHEDQWRWGVFKENGGAIYRPIPRDRDQAYTKFDGVLLNIIRSAAGLDHLQSFDYAIKDIKTFNYPARYIDRRFANETNLQQWITTAKELQQVLYDSLITESIKLLPPSVYPISGPEITSKLIARRNELTTYAKDYYLFLAREVDVPGTQEAEWFELTDSTQGYIELKIYKRPVGGEKGSLIYSRAFSESETSELRLYGIGGKDAFVVHLDRPSTITLRIIGGAEEDFYQINSVSRLTIYDTQQQLLPLENTSIANVSDTSTQYKYDRFKYDDKGLSPTLFYNRDDRVFIGLSYKMLRHKWRRTPFANQHSAFVRYSLTQKAFSTGYEGRINQFVGKWNLGLIAYYDQVKWTNFFGLGNDTRQLTNDRDYYRLRSQEVFVSASLNRQIGKQSFFSFTPFYRNIKLINDTDRFVKKVFLSNSIHRPFKPKPFFGLEVSAQWEQFNRPLLPTKGVSLEVASAYTQNITKNLKVVHLNGSLKMLFPIWQRLVFSVENGAASLWGAPEFYQLNSIGGKLLRGYRRDRFWGQTIFHNNNELQYLFNVKSRLFNGRAGILGFYDQGRVWLKGENSNTWHHGYGGGLSVAPFDKFSVTFMYGLSNENGRNGTFHIDFKRAIR